MDLLNDMGRLLNWDHVSHISVCPSFLISEASSKSRYLSTLCRLFEIWPLYNLSSLHFQPTSLPPHQALASMYSPFSKPKPTFGPSSSFCLKCFLPLLCYVHGPLLMILHNCDLLNSTAQVQYLDIRLLEKVF